MKNRIKCPCCDQLFKKEETNIHHIWPQCWYHKSGPLARPCLECHNEFNRLNPMNYVWSIIECQERWNKFIELKHLSHKQSIAS